MPADADRGNALIKQNLTNISISFCLRLSMQCELALKQIYFVL